MKTLHKVNVGSLRIVLRSDGGVYLARVNERRSSSYAEDLTEALHVGTSAVICDALADAFREMAAEIRKGGSQ